MLHYETVSPDLLTVLKRLQLLPEISGFRLVGGTSLSLQIGHRTSVDIDLFTDKAFDSEELQKVISNNFESFEVRWANRNGFTSMINDIKVDFFDWRVAFIKPVLTADGLLLADKQDIAAMKFETITTRKERKDYIDIAFLLKEYDLKTLLSLHKSKYPFISSQFVIESLMAIDYADNTEQPKLFVSYDWQQLKQDVIGAVTSYVDEAKNAIARQQDERLKKAEELLKKKRKEG